jgi:transcriptional regulator with XRE-family HTH domain
MWTSVHNYDVLASVKTLKESQQNRKQLGLAIRRHREEMGVSQEGLAEIIGCHRNYVGYLERGEQNVTIDMLARVAKAVGCTVTDLVSEAGL